MEETTLSSQNRTKSLIAIILLIFTTILWGSSFILTKYITKDVPIFLYLGLRFLIALIGFIPFFTHLKNVNKNIIIMGSITGLLYFFGIAFQTHGLQTTTAGKAGFITGLSTVIVPFITWLGFRKPLKKTIWVAVAFSTVGMAFLLLEGESGLIFGDILVLISAFFWAFYIIFNDKYVRLSDIYLYSIIQISVISAMCFICSLILKEDFKALSPQPAFWLIMIYMGIGIMTLTIIFQNWSQQYQGPAQTAIIFTLEPVFAALFGYFIGNEVLTIFGWIGCSLIFVAIIITALKNKELSKKQDINN